MRIRAALLSPLLLLACEQSPSEPAAPKPKPSAAPAKAASSVASAATAAEPRPKTPAEFQRHANKLAHKFIILDGHIDVAYRLEESKDNAGKLTEDILKRTEKGDFDLPRAQKGGLDAPFFSIYIPARYETGGAKKLANSLIDMVQGIVDKSDGAMTIAKTTTEVRQAFSAGKVAVLLGMENASPVERKLDNVQYFYDRGIRYITLTHSKDNHICDSFLRRDATPTRRLQRLSASRWWPR